MPPSKLPYTSAVSRFLAAFLVLAIALPSPALALRPMNAGMEENPANQSLRRELAGPAPAAGAEETLWAARSRGESRPRFHVARDDLFSLLVRRRGALPQAVVIPPKESRFHPSRIDDPLGAGAILGRLELAAAQRDRFPGAAELKDLVEAGDAVLLRASAVKELAQERGGVALRNLVWEQKIRRALHRYVVDAPRDPLLEEIGEGLQSGRGFFPAEDPVWTAVEQLPGLLAAAGLGGGKESVLARLKGRISTLTPSQRETLFEVFIRLNRPTDKELAAALAAARKLGEGGLAYRTLVEQGARFTSEGGFSAAPEAEVRSPNSGEPALPLNNPHRILTGHTGYVYSVAFSPNGRLLASAGHDKTVRLWDVRSGEELHVLTGHTGDVYSVAFSPNGRLLASAGHDETVRLWDVRSGEKLPVLYGHTDDVRSVTFSPDGRLLASEGDDGTVRLWNTRSGAKLRRVLPGDNTSWVRSVAFSLDGRLLASVSQNGTVRRWDMGSGAEFRRVLLVPGNAGNIHLAVFSPDVRLLASIDYDEVARLWDVGSGEELHVLTGHTDDVNSVAFSPNGRLLASAGHDETVRLWDVRSGEELHVLTGHTGGVYSVAFSPNGRLLASGSADGAVGLWELFPLDLPAGPPPRAAGAEEGAPTPEQITERIHLMADVTQYLADALLMTGRESRPPITEILKGFFNEDEALRKSLRKSGLTLADVESSVKRLMNSPQGEDLIFLATPLLELMGLRRIQGFGLPLTAERLAELLREDIALDSLDEADLLALAEWATQTVGLTAGAEEASPLVRETLAGLLRSPEGSGQAAWLGRQMASMMDGGQLEEFLTGLFWVTDRKEVGQMLVTAFGSGAGPAPSVLSALLLTVLMRNAAKDKVAGYLALKAVLSNLDPEARDRISNKMFAFLNESDPGRTGALKELPLYLDEAKLEAVLRSAWAGLPERLPARMSAAQAQEWAAHYQWIGTVYFMGSDHHDKRSDPSEGRWRAGMAFLAYVAMGRLNPQRAAELLLEWKEKIPARLNEPGLPATLAKLWAPGVAPEPAKKIVSQTYEWLIRDLAVQAAWPSEDPSDRRILKRLFSERAAQIEKMYADYLSLWSASQADPYVEEEAAEHYLTAGQYRVLGDQLKDAKLRELGLTAGAEEELIKKVPISPPAPLMKEVEIQAQLGSQGWARLDAGQAAALKPGAVAGLLIPDSARLESSPHAIYADSKLENGEAQRLLGRGWVPAGEGLANVVLTAWTREARFGDLILVRAIDGVSAESVSRMMEAFGMVPGERTARAVIGEDALVASLRPAAFQILAKQQGLPPVAILSAQKLQDEAGNVYTLLLMA